MKQILVIGAHPDDMEIGMGGTVARMAATGSAITSVVLTDGRRSPNPFEWPEEKMAQIRKEECSKAGSVLSVAEVVSFDLPDLKSASNYLSAKQRLAKLIEQIQPTEIYTLHEQLDRHPTHRLAGQLVVEGVREAKVFSIGSLWAYEVWGLFHSWDRIEYIDDQIGKKLLAIAQHKSQVASIPYGEGIAGLNRWRAAFADPHQIEPEGAFAEVFIKLL
jgi:LmbE family N-acetylglucosaminyl deacetylase